MRNFNNSFRARRKRVGTFNALFGRGSSRR